MALRVAFQMDPLEHLVPEKDTTIALALEAQRRGHELFHYTPKALTLSSSGSSVGVTARSHRLEVTENKHRRCQLLEETTLDLASCDVVLVRQDPPYDMAYLTATYLLDHITPHTLILNAPQGLREAPEKLLVTHFKELIPPTLITQSFEEIVAFHQHHGEIVLKPLYGHGGKGVFYLQKGDYNLAAIFNLLQEAAPLPTIAQPFLPAVLKGDKRILLIDGDPLGAIGRLPEEGSIRSNFLVGGKPQPVSLTEGDQEICAKLGPTLREKGLFFAGLDVIGDFLMEINVTSPTGIIPFNALNNTLVEEVFWDKVTSKLAPKES